MGKRGAMSCFDMSHRGDVLGKNVLLFEWRTKDDEVLQVGEIDRLLCNAAGHLVDLLADTRRLDQGG